MANGDTAPLRLPEPDRTWSIWDARTRGLIAGGVLLAYWAFSTLAFYKPTNLPGDTLGVILQNYGNMVNLVVAFYFVASANMNDKPKAGQ